MKDTVRIQMMDTFTIYVNENVAEHSFSRSRKGLTLVQYLIANLGKTVVRQDLFAALWGEDLGSNPENALKTLVSRVRVLLNGVSDGLGDCIVAEAGGYRWQSMPGLRIDLYEIEEIFSSLEALKGREHRSVALYARLLELYRGDLLKNSGQNEWAFNKALSLHSRYLKAVFAYLEVLKGEKRYRQAVEVCRRALDVDPFDDRLHIELMSGLVETNRTNEALVQYRHVVHMYNRYLGVGPNKELKEFYRHLANADDNIETNLATITEELLNANSGEGAYVCEYPVFKELFSLQLRNIERLGSTIFLGVIVVECADGREDDDVRQDSVMASLRDILKQNLRRGDTITRYSPTAFAVLLPTVNFTTGSAVMDRIKRLFYRRNPNSDITYTYRLGPLGSKKRPGGKKAKNRIN